MGKQYYEIVYFVNELLETYKNDVNCYKKLDIYTKNLHNKLIRRRKV